MVEFLEDALLLRHKRLFSVVQSIQDRLVRLLHGLLVLLQALQQLADLLLHLRLRLNLNTQGLQLFPARELPDVILVQLRILRALVELGLLLLLALRRDGARSKTVLLELHLQHSDLLLFILLAFRLIQRIQRLLVWLIQARLLALEPVSLAHNRVLNQFPAGLELRPVVLSVTVLFQYFRVLEYVALYKLLVDNRLRHFPLLLRSFLDLQLLELHVHLALVKLLADEFCAESLQGR